LLLLKGKLVSRNWCRSWVLLWELVALVLMTCKHLAIRLSLLALIVTISYCRRMKYGYTPLVCSLCHNNIQHAKHIYSTRVYTTARWTPESSSSPPRQKWGEFIHKTSGSHFHFCSCLSLLCKSTQRDVHVTYALANMQLCKCTHTDHA
jgi:hypothetical protein